MPLTIESRSTGGRLLAGMLDRVEVTVYVDGAATDADSGTPTFTVTRADGTVIVNAQNATSSVTGVYYYDIAAATNTHVDALTVALTGVWSAESQTFTHTVEVVGEHLFTLAEAREFDNSDGSTGAMNSATVYPAATIIAERDRITDLLEEWTEVSWVPRHYRGTLAGSGSRRLETRHYRLSSLIAASIGTTALTVSNVTLDKVPGVLMYESGVWSLPTSSNPLNVTVEYAHGHAGRPDGVTRIALTLLRDRLVKSVWPEGAFEVGTEFGSTRLVTEGGPRGNVSRSPEVNAWVMQHSLRTVIYG